MSITNEAYKNLDFVRDAIDLLSAGASWRGGRFIANHSASYDLNLPVLNQQTLSHLTRAMLLEGKAFVKIESTNEGVNVKQIQSSGDPNDDYIIVIERGESNLFPKGEPILDKFESQIDLYVNFMGLSKTNYDLNNSVKSLLINARSKMLSELGVPYCLLDISNISQVPVVSLMEGANQYKFKVDSLRWNLMRGLDDVGFHLSGLLGIEAVSWDWNLKWNIQRPCQYGHVYQLFLSKGIKLDPIKESELGGILLDLQAGLISKITYAECAATYGMTISGEKNDYSN